MSGFVSLNAGYTVSVRRRRLNVLVSPLDPDLSRGVCRRPVSFTRVYTPRNTRDRSITQLAKLSLIKKSFLVDLIVTHHTSHIIITHHTSHIIITHHTSHIIITHHHTSHIIIITHSSTVLLIFFYYSIPGTVYPVLEEQREKNMQL